MDASIDARRRWLKRPRNGGLLAEKQTLRKCLPEKPKRGSDLVEVRLRNFYPFVIEECLVSQRPNFRQRIAAETGWVRFGQFFER